MIDFTTDAEHNRLLPSGERRKEALRNKPCAYCEQYDFCPISNREDMVADWCPFDKNDSQVLKPEIEQEDDLPF